MSCVNTKSKEFKDTVNRLDVHPDNLEVVVHKYLNTEDRFPTDTEIMSELRGKPFEATMDDFKWYTQKLLYTPIVYGNAETAMSQARTLRVLFGANNDAVSVYRNSKGEYVVSVGTPKSPNIPFVLDNTLIDTLMNSVRETNPYHQIFKSIVDLIGKSNISIRQGLASENQKIAEDGNPAAFFPGRDEILFFPEHLGFLNNYTEAGRKSKIFQILAHELVHQFAFNTLDKSFDSLETEAEKAFHKEITSLYEEAQKFIGKDEFYGMTNVQEFIAEALTNRVFQKRLTQVKSNKKSLWQRIVDAFNKVFSAQGININNTLLADILSATEEFMTKTPEIQAEKATKEEAYRAEQELMDKIFLSEMEGQDSQILGFDSPTLNKVVARYTNRVSDYTYYMFTVGDGAAKRYAVNVPVNSRDTFVEARDKVMNLLRENGLDPDRYGYSHEFKKVGGRTAIYVSPKRSKKSGTTTPTTVKETVVDNAPRFTDREASFLDYLYDVRPDLASKVVDGLLDIGDLMMNEDELGVFAEAQRMENPFNISKVEEAEREQWATDTGVTIDHIESPTEEDFNNYEITGVTIVTSEGDRILISPKAGYKDPSGVVKNKDIRAMVGLNYLLEKYLMNNPREVSKFGESILSESAKGLYGENYDATKDSFTSDYSKYISGVTGLSVSESSVTEETDARLQMFGAEFEGASNSLVGIVPDALLLKVEDYIMSGGEIGLSEADAQEFLNYAEAAYAQDTTTTQEEQSIKKENQAYMERAITINQQIDNLNSSSILSATEVRHIAEQAVYWISDHITKIQETPGLAQQIYKKPFEDKDFASMSRADVVRTIGPDNMIAMCKEKFTPDNNDYEDFDTIDKAEEIIANWRAIMTLASDVFVGIEDFSIISSKDGKTNEVSEDYVADADNFNESNIESDVLENEGDIQEHWQVETKTLDVLATMSQKVRQALSKCYLLDKNGNKITSEFGINERVEVRKAVNSILRWTQGALNLEQVISKLKEREDSDPWVKQLITRLSDKSGKEADFQSQFFSTFCKHFQSYSIVIEKDGKYISKVVNANPALDEAITQVTTQYKIGEHPLFTPKGINKSAFNELKEAFKELEKYRHTGSDLNDASTREEAAKILGYISNLLGYYVTPDMVAENLNADTFKAMYGALGHITKSLEKNLDNTTYEPFKFKGQDSINGNVRAFLRPITETLEDTAITAFYDSGKMYQSYITPSYTTKLFQKFGLTGDDYKKFLKEQYGNLPWFKEGSNIERGWRNEWLRLLATDEKSKNIFAHKVQLNFNKKNYMKNMDDMEYTLSIITEYFSESSSDKQAMVPAWYRIPMLSNKPSSEFIRFWSYRGDNYKEDLTNGFKKIFDQEMSRIQTVEMRNLSKGDPNFIKNFDTNGKKFMFLDFMNIYLTGDKKDSELGKLIRKKLDGEKVDEVQLNKLAKEAIIAAMDSKAQGIVESWKSQGILKGVAKISGLSGMSEEQLSAYLENLVWNDTFAAMNILQLTITDTAFYKDAEDLQKRLAQIHAPGVRGNVQATDYKGNPVTDGKFRTLKLADADKVTSNIIDNVAEVFDRKIAEAPESEKAALRVLKDSLVGEKGAFRDINVADAQGYSCPSSYRKKALIFGKWSQHAEEVYQKLRKGTYTYSDLKVAFQVLKPFVYSQITKDSGVQNAPLSTLGIPVQYKNSEYLLIMADALLQGEKTSKPNLLRAIFDVMEESHFDSEGNYKTDGIDTVQFESTVKSGLMGKISLNDLMSDPHGEAIAKARMRTAVYDTNGMYNSATVDEVPFEDYCLQQEVPEHFKEHEQIHGSQLRYIIPSELEGGTPDNPITYNLEGKPVSAQEFKAEYENTIAENIQESIDELAEELSLNDFDSVKDRNIALSKILQREILSSPRYGIDLLQACSVDENGKFRIPLGDPIQSKRVEQLINSIVKNRINKQKIPGGPVVQVSNFGTSKELNIRFKDKNGELLMTRAEYEKHPMKKEVTQADKFNAGYKRGAQVSSETMSYEEYIKKNQAGIAYFEVFAPIYANELFTKFADKNGVINIEAIEMLEPDLLKTIGYRIPTEDKYSAAPLKIVGFLPREAGDGIMLPADITLLTGSDFDVDKEYLMRKDYGIKENKISRSEMHKVLYEELVSSQKGKLPYTAKIQLNELIDQFLNDPFDSSILVNTKTAKGYMSMPKGAYNKLLRTYIRTRYSVNRPTEGRAYRNNKIVDMTYEVLTHETQANKVLNPGGFDPQKRMGYLVSAYRQHSNKYTWGQLQSMSIEQLKDLSNSNKNLCYVDVHTQFYRQNNAAGALIGIFAVNRTAHAVLESESADGSASYLVNVESACKLMKPFTVAGMEFGGMMPFDMRYDRTGTSIGKVLGSLVGSAADAVKDPVLNLMNINSNTANILTTLVRLGMPFDNAALFLSQSAVSDVLATFSKENITGYTSLSKVIEEKLQHLKDEYGLDKKSKVAEEELTYEELVDGINSSDPRITFKVLTAFKNFQSIAGAMQMPTFSTRFNSVASTVGPLIIDNLITEQKMNRLSMESNIVDADGNPVDISDIFAKHPILGKFAETYDIARKLLGNMPANSIGFRNLLDEALATFPATIFENRKLLSTLSDFYQSYLVMKSGCVWSNELGYYITEFPREFMKKEYKDKYPDNAFIQAIKYGTDKGGRATLQIDITGLDTQQKERLSSGWIDLHKIDPELSIKLFKYNFFRGGIGFSPKTFMALVPTYVKERIPGYVDTFRVMPSITPEIVLDQFIRNNWNDNRLVPKKKITPQQLSNGNMMIAAPSEIKELKDVRYFKAKVGNDLKLFTVLLESPDAIEIKEVSTLGSNKDYIELSEADIDTPLDTSTITNATENAIVEKDSELAEPPIAEETTESASVEEDVLDDMLHKILVIEGVRTEGQAKEYVKNYKAKSDQEKARMEKQTKKFIETRLKNLKIEVNEKQVDDIYKKLC